MMKAFFCLIAFLTITNVYCDDHSQVQPPDLKAMAERILGPEFGQGSCQCSVTECSCCVVNVPLVNMICANLTWDPTTLTVTLYLEVNNVVVYQGSISDPNPVEVCKNFICNICVVLNNLNITDTGACGQVYLNISCFGYQHGWDMGSFSLGTNCSIPKRKAQIVPPADLSKVISRFEEMQKSVRVKKAMKPQAQLENKSISINNNQQMINIPVA